MKTRRFYFLISLITLLGMGQGHLKASNNEETITLKFVETSDVHGCYFPYDFIQNKQMRGSLARVSSYVKEEREVYGDNLILMDNGDILQGQPVAYYYNYMDTASVHVCAAMLNYMRYDVGNMGNHDVETGHAVYDRWVSQCDFPILGANIVDVKTGKPYLKPYEVLERNGVKVVVLGMITKRTTGYFDWTVSFRNGWKETGQCGRKRLERRGCQCARVRCRFYGTRPYPLE